jgi:hypothetical protein
MEYVKAIDRASGGDVVVLGFQNGKDRIVEVGDKAIGLPKEEEGPHQEAILFEDVFTLEMLIVYREDFDSRITRRVDASLSEVAEVVPYYDKSELRELPTEKVVEKLRYEDADDMYVEKFDGHGFPTIWMWDKGRDEHYADQILSELQVFNGLGEVFREGVESGVISVTELVDELAE